MRPAATALALAVLTGVAVFAGGCATETTVATGPLRPRSYRAFEGTVAHGVGLLRRIVVPPAHATFTHDGDPVPDMATSDAATLHDAAVPYLRDWKGYEVIDVVPEAGDADLAALRAWATAAELGADPPPPVRQAAEALCAPHRADGILFLSGRRNPPTTLSYWLTVMTASLAWPYMLSTKEGVLQADVLEGSTGRVVWRANRRGVEAKGGLLGEPYAPLPPREVEDLLAPIEPAVPEILTRE